MIIAHAAKDRRNQFFMKLMNMTKNLEE